MNLCDETKQYREKAVRRFYSHAIEAGAKVSDVEYQGMHLYKVSIGNMELTYMGKVDGTAHMIAASGEVF